MKGSKEFAKVLEGAGVVAEALSGGKTASDIMAVERAEQKYDGGFVALQKDTSRIQTDKAIGDTAGQLDIPDSHKVSFIENSIQKADIDGRGEEVRKDFAKAGLIDAEGNVQPDNWVSGIGFLRANNMSSHNSLVSGGMMFSGALGEDSTVQATSLDSLSTGSKIENNQDARQKLIAFNAERSLHGESQITYDEETGQLNIPDQETGEAFLAAIGRTDMMEKTRKNAVNETLGVIGEELGLSAEAVVYGVGGAVVGLASMALANKVLPRKKSIPSKIKSDSQDKNSDTKSNNIDTVHENSLINKESIPKNGESTNPSKTKQEINARLDEVSANNAKSFAKGVDNGGISEKDFIAKEQNAIQPRGYISTLHLAPIL